jgi:hypothetical protein
VLSGGGTQPPFARAQSHDDENGQRYARGGLASDTAVMGEQALERRGQVATAAFLALIAASVLTLGVLTVAG